MPNAWNMFAKKIYLEGKAKNPNYEFKQALVDASKRKSEMGSSTKGKAKTAKKGRGKSRSVSAAMAGGKRKSRRHRSRSRH
jgi:hypothetical protein